MGVLGVWLSAGGARERRAWWYSQRPVQTIVARRNKADGPLGHCGLQRRLDRRGVVCHAVANRPVIAGIDLTGRHQGQGGFDCGGRFRHRFSN